MSQADFAYRSSFAQKTFSIRLSVAGLQPLLCEL